ncbi:hypothetical protein MP228_011271 [Amoeboaphelidium protococcarum]|nr:hypothetical protein MP228_011271 [Amoeboaphelidium protococcarum]
MQVVHQEVFGPTGVNLSISAQFTGVRRQDLIVVKSNVLTIYHLYNNTSSASTDNNNNQGHRLVHYYSEKFLQNISDIKAVRNQITQCDLLLVCFADAKLSILAWDSNHFQTETVSLHFFEDEVMRSAYGIKVAPCIRVDQHQYPRCAVMRMAGDLLAFIPFKDGKLSAAQSNTFNSNNNNSLNNNIINNLTHPSFVVQGRDIDHRIVNIVDFVFMPGYQQPTIAVLCQPVPTWSGSLNKVRDNSIVILVSIDLQQKSFSVIGSCQGLPFDLYKILDCGHQSLGGALCLGVNELVYVDSNFKAVGVSMNGFSRITSKLSMIDYSHLKLDLDFACAVMISSSNRALISLKDGNLIMVTFVNDGGIRGGISKIEVQKIGRIVEFVNSMTLYQDNFLFIGSCNTKSLLLRLSGKLVSVKSAQRDGNVQSSSIVQDSNADMDLDDLDALLGLDQDDDGDVNLATAVISQQDAQQQNASDLLSPSSSSLPDLPDDQWYQTVDEIPCLSMSKKFAIGESLNGVYLNDLNPGVDKPLEFVVCNGVGRHSSLYILRENLVPIIGNSYDIKLYIMQMWTVNAAAVAKNNDQKCLLFASVQTTDANDDVRYGTMILQSFRGELREVTMEFSAFKTQNAQTLHVGIVKANNSSRMALVQVCKQAMLAYSLDGRRVLAQLDVSELNVDDSHQSDYYIINAFTSDRLLFCLLNTGHLLCFEMGGDDKFHQRWQVTDVDTACLHSSTDQTRCQIVAICGTAMVFLDIESGQNVKSFAGVDSKVMRPINIAQSDQRLSEDDKIQEVMSFETSRGSQIIVFLNGRHHLMVYQQFNNHKNTFCGFKKIQTILSPPCYDDRAEQRQLYAFSQIKGLQSPTGAFYHGTFVAGKMPHFVQYNDREELIVRPMALDGPVLSFSQISSTTQSDGFVYFNSQNQLRVCDCEDGFDLSLRWPQKTVPLNDSMSDNTPLQASDLLYLRHSQKYCLVAYKDVEFNAPKEEVVPPRADKKDLNDVDAVFDQKEVTNIKAEPKQFLPMQRSFSIRLMSPVTWQSVDSFEFEEHEQVTAACYADLTVKVSGLEQLRTYLIIGTMYVLGEDHYAKGKVHIFEIVQVIPEANRPETNHKLKHVISEEVKGGPVTALCVLEGNLCVAISSKVMMFSFENMQNLLGIAFYETTTYITSMKALKSFLIVGDVQNSVWFFVYQEEPSKLAVLGRDYHKFAVVDLQFMADQNRLGFLCGDDAGNLQVLTYAPQNLASLGGMKLLRAADYKGCILAQLERVGKRSSQQEHGCLYLTVDGRIGYFWPVNEQSFRRMASVANQMQNTTKFPGGLNPKWTHAFDPWDKQFGQPVRNVLNVTDLVFNRVLNNSHRVQQNWARNRSVNLDKLYKDLFRLQSDAKLS